MENNYFFDNKSTILLYYLLKTEENKDDWDIIDLQTNGNRIKPIIENGFISDQELFGYLEYFLKTGFIEYYNVLFELKSDITNIELINEEIIIGYRIEKGKFYKNLDLIDYKKYNGSKLYIPDVSLGPINKALIKSKIEEYKNKWNNRELILGSYELYKNEYQINSTLETLGTLTDIYDNKSIIIKEGDVGDEKEILGNKVFTIDLLGSLLTLQDENIIKINSISFDNNVIFNIALLKNIKQKIKDTIIYEKILDIQEDINKSGFIFYEGKKDFQVRDELKEFEEVEKNLWAGIYLLYAILKEGGKVDINDYLSAFKKYRKDKFGGRESKSSDLDNAKSRLKQFLNEIGGEIIKNDDNKFEIVLK